MFLGLDQRHDAAQKRPETWRQKYKNKNLRDPKDDAEDAKSNTKPVSQIGSTQQHWRDTKMSFQGSRFLRWLCY